MLDGDSRVDVLTTKKGFEWFPQKSSSAQLEKGIDMGKLRNKIPPFNYNNIFLIAFCKAY